MKRFWSVLLLVGILLLVGCEFKDKNVELIPLKSIAKTDETDERFENDSVVLVFEDGYELLIGECRTLVSLINEDEEDALCYDSIFKGDMLLVRLFGKESVKQQPKPDERGSMPYYFVNKGKFYENFTAKLEVFLRENVTTQDLTEIALPEGKAGVAMGNSLFSNYQKLEAVTIPGMVRKIGADCFNGCVALKDIYFGGTKAQWETVEKEENWDAYTGEYTVHCTDGDVAKVWTENTDYAFSCVGDGNGTCSVTDIRLQTTWGVTLKLSKELVGDTVVSFDTSCLGFSSVPWLLLEADFQEYICKPLEAVVARGALSQYAMDRITKAYYIRVSLEGLGAEEKQTLLKKYPYLETTAVYVLDAMVNTIDLSELQENLETHANMNYEKNKTLADHVAQAAAETGVFFPNKYAYRVEDGDAIRKLEAEEGLRSICANAFAECSNLMQVILPSTVETLGEGVFYGCSALTEIIYNGTVEQWNAVEKGAHWDEGTGNYVVHCTDGDVAKVVGETENPKE